MSAREIIEQIKALSPEEREEVANYLQQSGGGGALDEGSIRYADQDEFQEAAARVFETHDELLRRLAK